VAIFAHERCWGKEGRDCEEHVNKTYRIPARSASYSCFHWNPISPYLSANSVTLVFPTAAKASLTVGPSHTLLQSVSSMSHLNRIERFSR
jgi:hypothetical protein